MAKINSLFNYGTPPEEGGWKDFQNENFEDIVESSDIAGVNPNQAVPSPFARFEVARRAFENLTDGNYDSRDEKTVSDVLDALQALFEGSTHLDVKRNNVTTISNTLIELGKHKEEDSHLKVYGEALKDYMARESFMILGNESEENTLFVFSKGLDPFAITSPTSIVLPTPDTDDPLWEDVLVEGTFPVFKKNRRLIIRNKNFVVFVYTLLKAISSKNGGKFPAPIKYMADYLDKEYHQLSRFNSDVFDEVKSIWEGTGDIDLNEIYDQISVEGSVVNIFGVNLCRLRDSKASEDVEKESDLIVKPSKSNAIGSPLVLSVNIPLDSKMRYTSKTNFWNSQDSKLEYNDLLLKKTPISGRKVLPNGTPYPQGFIYDHDFLSDYLIRLPYKFNKNIFFNGNLDDSEIDEGFIPPITETYFEFFRVEDLKDQMKINLKKAGGEVKGVEVFLAIPVTSGKNVILKKTYTFIDEGDDLIGKYNQIAKGDARGMIIDLKAAVNYFPNIRFEKPIYNHYLIQLARDSFSLPNFEIELEAVKTSDSNELLRLKNSVRMQEDGVNTVVHYALEKSDFTYLKINLIRAGSHSEFAATCILVPNNFFEYSERNTNKSLIFGFDFGTSNTHVSVTTDEGDDSEWLKFELPVEQCVSTIDEDALLTDDVTSFKVYQSQMIIPDGKEFGFPIPTVISKYKETPDSMTDDADIPFLYYSIPFLYGKEDYGASFSKIVRNLKWKINDSKNNHYSKAFINELVFLAQVFTATHRASLNKSSITWTYPISMQQGLIKTLRKCWGEAYANYFDQEENAQGNVMEFTESMAPMVYYISGPQSKDIIGTVVSIDIGGGTSDIVVTPNGQAKESKLASIGLGGDSIFAIDDADKANKIPMLRMALKQISKKIESQKKGPDDNRYQNVLKDLEKLNQASEAEATNALFGLPFNKALKDISEDVDFNKWLISRPAFHPVFHYYYASLLYYLANLMKNNPEIFISSPERFFFSGSGSKILNIIGKGSAKELNQFTLDLFEFFLDGYEFEDPADIFILRMEKEEPKEITAKGSIITGDDPKELRTAINKLTGTNQPTARILRSNSPQENDESGSIRRVTSFSRKSQKEKKGNIIMNYKMIPSIDKNGTTLTESKMNDSDIQEEISKEVEKFHKMYEEFIELAIENGIYYEEDDLETFRTDFFNLTVTRLKTALRRQLKVSGLDKKKESDAEYTDVPFFLIIKQLLKQSVFPQDQFEE